MPSLRNRTNKTTTEEKTMAGKKRKFQAAIDATESPGKKLKVEVKEESVDVSLSDPDGSDTENHDINDHMRRREENLRANQEFFQQFGIEQARQDMLSSMKKPSKPSCRGLKKEKVKVELLPRRSSLRLQNKTPEGCELPPESLITKASMFTPHVDEHPRPPSGPLEMKDYLYKTSSDEDHNLISKVFATLDGGPKKKLSSDLQSFVDQLSRVKLTADQVAKVVKERSFSVAIHPCETKLLAATGDKWGNLGLWDVNCGEDSESDGVCCYSPHSRPITGLEFPAWAPHTVYTCGYDGSMRCGDMNKGVFQEVYSLAEEEDILLRNFSFTSSHTMLVSQNTGCVALVDTRTNNTTAERTYQLHDRSLRTVSVHPVQTDIFCTGGVEGTLCIWDLRNIKVKNSSCISKLPHGRSINSAYFSPVSGKYILSTSMDDKLTIFDTSVIGPQIKHKKIISHNNHTGRWLTGFRATWHPSREDVFVVGSMNRPREVTLFSNEGKKLLSLRDEELLGSVCSLNVIHPTRPVVVGANASGRLHMFM